MTRWAMVADLRRCVGCQTCTAACKHANATSPAVQWRKVLDMEVGSYPDVRRAFVPVGCMHCSDPPCMHVCPSTATGQRADGIVTIDYDICIGCAYCAVACPYQARYKVQEPVFAYGGGREMKNEARREDPARLGVAQKCTWCADRIDFGLENGLTPGVDPRATPACVNSCIADALHFGDADDPRSNVSKLLAENASFKMHAELGTDPGFHYVYATEEDEAPPEILRTPARLAPVGGVEPWLQRHWDWRAAGNFMFGGSGAGLVAIAGLVAFMGGRFGENGLAGLGFVALGLFLVFLETGRPFRAPLNVFLHPGTSWMTREAMVAVLLFPTAVWAWWDGGGGAATAALLLALAFVYCQARILTEAKGIPAWRTQAIAPLIVGTGLVEGAGLGLVGLFVFPVQATGGTGLRLAVILLILIAGRASYWIRYRRAVAEEAPAKARQVVDGMSRRVLLLGHALPAALLVLAYVLASPVMILAAALLAVGFGWWMKFVIVTRASYNQGFAIDASPERGAGGAGPGLKPGWG